MRSRNSSTLALTLSPLSLVVWLACKAPDESAAATDLQGSGEASPPGAVAPTPVERSGGSALPCAVPLAWRIVRVDAEFGIRTSQAEDALRKAMSEWEQAAGRKLFALDPAGGAPIRLVYDERQARGQERARLEADMQEIGQGLDWRRSQLARRTDVASASFSQHELLTAELKARVSAHNDLVRRWNERGGAPPDVQRRLRAAGQTLELENQERLARERQLAEVRHQIDSDRARLEEDVAEYNRLAADIDARFPPSRVESGVYREAIRLVNGRPASASREIRVYRFSHVEDLARVLAHELGHSLGLEHVAAAGALMSEEYGPGAPQGARWIQRDDVDALVSLCPGLFEG